jgi:hypothetical protein
MALTGVFLRTIGKNHIIPTKAILYIPQENSEKIILLRKKGQAIFT